MSLLTQASLVLTPTAYKANKLYSVVPSSGNGDMVTTRATTATRVNSSGLVENVATGIPRLDYTGSVPSILLEPQRTNVRTYSEEILFANGYSITNSTLSTVSIITPSLSSSANLFTLNVGANTGNNSDGFNFGSGISLTNLTQYTQSLFVKPFGTTTFIIRNNVIGGTHDFILSGNGTAPAISGSLQAASITPYTNGWYRVSWTFTTTSTVPGNRGDFWALKTNVADGVNGVYIWGSQLETGSYATSYIPTTTSTVTRNGDIMTLSNLYANNFITSAGGTWFLELNNNFSLTRDSSSIFGLFDIPTSQNGFGVKTNATGRLTIIKNIGGVQVNLYLTITDNVKIAIKWNGTTADVFVNGVKVVASTVFTTTIMEFLNANNQDVPKSIKSTMLFPTPLTDTEMIALTTL
jgi:hypothetical protein